MCVLGTVAAVQAVALPRRRRPVTTDADGVTSIEGPRSLVVVLLAAWALALVLAVVWAVLLATGRLDFARPTLVVIFLVAIVASTPDLVRLLTGRLHRWRIVMTDTDLTYRGYRTDVTVPWSKVRGAEVRRTRPAGVVIDLRGQGEDPLVSPLGFTHPPEQIAEEIDSRARR